MAYRLSSTLVILATAVIATTGPYVNAIIINNNHNHNNEKKNQIFKAQVYVEWLQRRQLDGQLDYS